MPAAARPRTWQAGHGPQPPWHPPHPTPTPSLLPAQQQHRGTPVLHPGRGSRSTPSTVDAPPCVRARACTACVQPVKAATAGPPTTTTTTTYHDCVRGADALCRVQREHLFEEGQRLLPQVARVDAGGGVHALHALRQRLAQLHVAVLARGDVPRPARARCVPGLGWRRVRSGRRRKSVGRPGSCTLVL